MLRTYQSESNIRPIEYDATSSESVVYHNYDIQEVERRNEDGTLTTFYVYKVDELTKDEYNNYRMNDINNAIDDILVIILEDK